MKAFMKEFLAVSFLVLCGLFIVSHARSLGLSQLNSYESVSAYICIYSSINIIRMHGIHAWCVSASFRYV